MAGLLPPARAAGPLLPPPAGGLPPLSKPAPSIKHVSFDQSKSCFAAGTSTDYRVFQCDPVVAKMRERFTDQNRDDVGFSIVEMVHRSNLIALVGDRRSSQFAPDKIVLWDDEKQSKFKEYRFDSKVVAVCLSLHFVVAVLEAAVQVFHLFQDRAPIIVPTRSNPRGACAISQVTSKFTLVCPSNEKGKVAVVVDPNIPIMHHHPAHEEDICCIGLTQDGQLYATASVKGTLIRIFNVEGSLLQTLRRGLMKADLNCISFSSNLRWLAASSRDSETVHIFMLKLVSHERRSLFSRLAFGKLKEARSDIKIPILGKGLKVEFGESDCIMIAGLNGCFVKCKFDARNRGKKLDVVQSIQFLDL